MILSGTADERVQTAPKVVIPHTRDLDIEYQGVRGALRDRHGIAARCDLFDLRIINQNISDLTLNHRDKPLFCPAVNVPLAAFLLKSFAAFSKAFHNSSPIRSRAIFFLLSHALRIKGFGGM